MKVLFLDSQESQQIEFLLPFTNEYHQILVTSKEVTYRNKKLINKENKLPIVCTIAPSTKISELSCKRYFVSKLIQKLKLELVRKYSFFFSIKAVKELNLLITQELDIFDSLMSTYTLSANLILDYSSKEKEKEFIETFVFSKVSLLGDIVLDTSTTLPPIAWNVLKNYVAIPKNTVYSFKENNITFSIGKNNYTFNINTNQVTWEN